MTTAREQARVAAANTHCDYSYVHADAASNVWEPLLREFVEAFGESTLIIKDKENSVRVTTAWLAAREALGD